VVRLLLIYAAASAGCYAPDYLDCAVRCGEGNSCPAALSCIDGWCQSGSATCGDMSAVTDASTDLPAADLSATDLAGVRCKAATFCDEFETGISRWTINKYGDGTSVTSDTTRSHRGSRSAYFRVDPPSADAGVDAGSGAARAALVNQSVLKQLQPGPSVWIRFWYWAPPRSDHGPTIVHANTGVPAYRGVSVNIDQARTQLDHSYVPMSPRDVLLPAAPFEQWNCLVLRVDFRHAAPGDDFSELTISGGVNGKNANIGLVDGGANDGIPDGLSDVDVGLTFSVTDTFYEMWVDDVMIDGAPISCDD
jgi:hypothetical protein